jgi:hypothetical protein
VRAAALLSLLIAAGANAAAIYRCADAGGAPAFQGTPCATHAAQTVMHVRGQPLIGGEAPVPSEVRPAHAHPASRKSRAHAPAPGHSRRGPAHAHATSWECRAADGEVFYRHTHCPHSVPGDGVMRSGGTYALRRGGGSRSRARSAWDPVPVHARKVPRSEACRQINAVAAVERDGSARDEHVSVYEHDLGRDPCAGY